MSRFNREPSISMALPAAYTSLIGRQSERAALGVLLHNPDCRVLSVVGPGGIGKTRLALAVAMEQANTFKDGVTWVPLAGLMSPSQLIPALAGALGLRVAQRDDAEHQLLSFLESKEMLLVLDNAEHLVSGMAVLTRLLQRTHSVSTLVTSREPLGLYGEWLFQLGGLPYPQNHEMADWTSYVAVQLFADRTRQVLPGWNLEPEDAAIVQICRLVDGMPLALELAAALMQEQSSVQIVAGLETSLDFLTSGLRDMPDRHRSIGAAFEYSWRLLEDAERQVLCCLSVCRNGFTVAAAQAIAETTPAVLECLVRKALLRRADDDRYDFHPLIQNYAGVKLTEAQVLPEVRRRHMDYFGSFAEKAALELTGPHQGVWLDRIEGEHDNVRAALHWALDTGKILYAIRFGKSLWRFWDKRGYLTEGRAWLDAMLSVAGTPVPVEDHIMVLMGAGMLALEQRDVVRSKCLFEEMLELATRHDRDRDVATALTQLGHIAARSDDYRTARQHYEESLRLRQQIGEARQIAITRTSLGRLAIREGNYGEARDFLEQGLRVLEQVGDHDEVAATMMVLADTVLQQGDWHGARTLYQQALAQWYAIVDWKGIPILLRHLAFLAQDYERRPHGLQRATRLLGAADALGTTMGLSLLEEFGSVLSVRLDTLRSALGDKAFAAAWAEGHDMTIDQAVAFAKEM
ncbi:MAG: hypothetical protein NVS4B8_07370 [Herpetosiphon sp.]